MSAKSLDPVPGFPHHPRIPRSPRPLRFRSRPRSRVRVVAVALTCVLVGGGAPAAYAVLEPEQEPSPSAGAPAADSGAGERAEGRPYRETRLLFGTVRPDGGPDVTEKEFHAFVTEEVTPLFPDGLTVQDGYGQYRDDHGTVERERSYELTLYYPVGQTDENDPKIERLREAYVERFDQESVARVDDAARVDF
ncbi:DUF3574 domain-containing protein [Streptomyces armeniacus]|uniref:DUF3574 domain-containing protein n=1 Tax=Streptomyces armeniacus TaxID=83291 RepID=A0A345XT23_9ACTN|nr:DUF3574 domain-containing protein [Streptomyces armeniacus]AXK34789.1 DUF3574 domain-containing protein [Streptomyces armeniacus]